MGNIYKRGKIWYIDVRSKGRRIRKKIGSSKKIAELALKDAEVKIARDGMLETAGCRCELKRLLAVHTGHRLGLTRSTTIKDTRSVPQGCPYHTFRLQAFEGARKSGRHQHQVVKAD